MKISPEQALDQLKAHPAEFLKLFEKGKLQVEIYQPEGTDKQTPHDQDELYVIISGTGRFINDGQETSFAPGDLFFVEAGKEHRFINFTDDFSTWVIFV